MAIEKTESGQREGKAEQLTLIDTPQSMPMDKEEAFDFYPTPPWCTELLIRHYPPPLAPIYEPGAGDGSIARVLTKYHHPVTAIEIQEKFKQQLEEVTVKTYIRDVLGFRFKCDSVFVGNPPFCMALKFLQHIFRHNPWYVAFLLRLDFLGSQERADFHNAHPLTQLLVLGKRPGFTINGKTDLYNYGWFIWHKDASHRPPVVVIP